MTKEEVLKKVLISFSKYYNVQQKDDGVFCARAEFCSENSQHFIFKSVQISKSISRELVYFSLVKTLFAQELEKIAQEAWYDGLSKVESFYGHRNSDIKLVIIADFIEQKAAQKAKRENFRKDYKFSIFGWSDFYLAAFGVCDGVFASNKRGKKMVTLFKNLH